MAATRILYVIFGFVAITIQTRLVKFSVETDHDDTYKFCMKCCLQSRITNWGREGTFRLSPTNLTYNNNNNNNNMYKTF
jgi:hypothetical protein